MADFVQEMRFHVLLYMQQRLKFIEWHRLGLKNYQALVNEVDAEIARHIEADKVRRAQRSEDQP